MKKDITIITSLVGAGLEREYLLLRELLQSHSHYVMGVHYTDLSCELHPSDITISLEVISPRTLSLSRENWFAPNCEWYNNLNDRYLPQISKIICKTKDCYDIWCRKVGPEKCVFTSFEARDIYRPEIPREVKFLHIAGKSEYKNTEAVCNAWRQRRLPHINALPHLTIVARAPVFDSQWKEENPFPDNNVTHIARATDDEIIQLMNGHQFHLIPSMYEGFGHCIHEALGVGGIVLTTNAAPMNSYDGIWKPGLIPAGHNTPRALAQLHHVYPAAIDVAARQVCGLQWGRPEEAAEQSKRAREAFLANREFFRTTFMGLVNAVKSK
jgi:hypothetical protein